MSSEQLLFPEEPWVIEPMVSDDIFIDRAEFLDFFYEWSLKTPARLAHSTVLLGRRRMGKTEIFRRVVNRLFFEQDPRSPDAVVPVYYSFRDSETDAQRFAINYLENFMRYYVGFKTRRPEAIQDSYRDEKLIAWIEESRHLFPFDRDLELLLSFHESIVKTNRYSREQDAVEIPRRMAANFKDSIVVFLDEFQNTRLPDKGFDIVGYMQEAVESRTCPHFVTGSAMSILAREILGRGALFGRFDSMPIKPLSEYWGAELALKVAQSYNIEVPQLMAPVIANRCGGNPYYIDAVVRRAAVSGTPLINEEVINSTLAVDISSGFIWSELYEQVNGWIQRINEHGITKWILYLSALEEEDRISLERIQEQLKIKDGKDVPLDTIRDVLIRLSRGDLLEYRELGGWFHKVDDQILGEFLKRW